MTENTLLPNSYQTPNDYVDVLLPLLTSEEWVLFSFAIRHILGFHDRIAKRRRRISISCFQHGYGIYPGCGLGLGAIRTALGKDNDDTPASGLIGYGVLIPIGKPGNKGQNWELPFTQSQIDITGLRSRLHQRAENAKKNTQKAREQRALLTDNTDESAVGSIDGQYSTLLTDNSAALLTDNRKETHLETHLGNPPDSRASAKSDNADGDLPTITCLNCKTPTAHTCHVDHWQCMECGGKTYPTAIELLTLPEYQRNAYTAQQLEQASEWGNGCIGDYPCALDTPNAQRHIVRDGKSGVLKVITGKPDVATRQTHNEQLSTIVVHWKTVAHLWDKDLQEFTGKHFGRDLVYIGRVNQRNKLPASDWQNSFVIGSDGTRSEVVEKFRKKLMADRDLLARIPELIGKALVCWCSGQVCHGDVLAAQANTMMAIVFYSESEMVGRDCPYPDILCKYDTRTCQLGQSSECVYSGVLKTTGIIEQPSDVVGKILDLHAQPDVVTQAVPNVLQPSKRLDAGDMLVFRSLKTKHRATLARLRTDPLASTSFAQDGKSVVMTLFNHGLLRKSETAPNQEQLYALTEKGTDYCSALTESELKRARDSVQAKTTKVKAQRNAKTIECPEDVAPYATIVCQRFYGAANWDDMIEADKKFVIQVVNQLRKQYSVDDIDYVINEWFLKQGDWGKSATLGALINGKGHIAKALSERDATQKPSEVYVELSDNFEEDAE